LTGLSPDLSVSKIRLTIDDLVTAYRKDPKVRQLRTVDDLETMLATWVDENGTDRLRGFGYLQIVAFRDKQLGTGLSPARVNRYLSAMRRCWNWGNPHYVQTPWPGLVTDTLTSEPISLHRTWILSDPHDPPLSTPQPNGERWHSRMRSVTAGARRVQRLLPP
jgi:hypothetical protein